jgi:hypothetical protein
MRIGQIRYSVCRWQPMAHRTIGGMTDDDVGRPEPPSAKAATAQLWEARSLSRRADRSAAPPRRWMTPLPSSSRPRRVPALSSWCATSWCSSVRCSEARRRQVVELGDFRPTGISFPPVIVAG